MIYAPTEEVLISHWLDLTGETFGEYAWVAPGTWAAIAKLVPPQYIEGEDRGFLADYLWVKPVPFAVKILMNPFAEEGRLYLAHAGTKYFKYPQL